MMNASFPAQDQSTVGVESPEDCLLTGFEWGTGKKRSDNEDGVWGSSSTIEYPWSLSDDEDDDDKLIAHDHAKETSCSRTRRGDDRLDDIIPSQRPHNCSFSAFTKGNDTDRGDLPPPPPRRAAETSRSSTYDSTTITRGWTLPAIPDERDGEAHFWKTCWKSI